MKMIKRSTWVIMGGTVLLAVIFSLGYLMGGRAAIDRQSTIAQGNTLPPIDMGRAFGGVTLPVDTESARHSMVMSLSELLAGLEKKVAEHPENIDQQLLLAQTYNELDYRSKSLKLLHSLHQQAPKNAQVKISLATTLMMGTEKQALQTALKLFDEAIQLRPELASTARLQQKEIRVKLDNVNTK